MFFKTLLAKLFGRWPADLPRLYPNLDELQLAQFLTTEQYRRIKLFENVYILPFVSKDGEDDQVCFGLGLGRLMIRNLMVLSDVSIHGPEDTASVPFESAQSIITERGKSSYVTGIAGFGEHDFTLQAEIYRPTRPMTRVSVQEREFRVFIRQCTTAIGKALGSGLKTTVADAWEVGQPKEPESLIRCGELHFHYDPDDARRRSSAAKAALLTDPGFVVPAWDLDDESEDVRKLYLDALQRDPYNAQLCFTTFCTVWKSQRPQPEAVQFCRKAIELSPGHGKAHMCAPHAAPANADMLYHSELGYRLLPGNSFAVNNYVIYLEQHGSPTDKLMELAQEGIASDPCDPSNHMRLIDLYCKLGNYRAALRTAEQLQDLFEPVMNERALYCLRQNPEIARLIETGQYDPAAENRRLIADLRRQAKQGR